ncbi:MAG: AbrB family transcriptional regulator [Oscillospiraceae bacterium]|nr:AbrB family transcriptional regulator [Oscillospiraceae bacterium]
MELILTLLIAVAGGLLALKLKVPAGAIIGGMVFVAAFNILFGMASMPSETRVVVQSVAGALIGASIDKEDVLRLKRMAGTAFTMVILMLILSAGAGFLLFFLSDMDIATCLFSVAPGGMMDMTLASQDLGADASRVVLFQILRVMIVIGIFPTILKVISKKFDHSHDGQPVVSAQEQMSHGRVLTSKQKYCYLAITLAIGFASGILGKLSGIPAGTMIFSMAAVGVFNVLTGKGYLPMWLKKAAQMCSGALIGVQVCRDDLNGLGSILLLALMLILCYLLITVGLSVFISRVKNIDLTTALFALCPGGLTDVALISAEMGAHMPTVAVIQTLRLVGVVTFFPLLTNLMVGIL